MMILMMIIIMMIIIITIIMILMMMLITLIITLLLFAISLFSTFVHYRDCVGYKIVGQTMQCRVLVAGWRRKRKRRNGKQVLYVQYGIQIILYHNKSYYHILLQHNRGTFLVFFSNYIQMNITMKCDTVLPKRFFLNRL